jgi:hypothetical protein
MLLRKKMTDRRSGILQKSMAKRYNAENMGYG